MKMNQAAARRLALAVQGSEFTGKKKMFKSNLLNTNLEKELEEKKKQRVLETALLVETELKEVTKRSKTLFDLISLIEKDLRFSNYNRTKKLREMQTTAFTVLHSLDELRRISIPHLVETED